MMLKVADVMTRYVEFLEPEASVRDAAVMMGELDVGALPIGSPERLEGIVTDRDILYRVVAAGLSPDTRVSDILSRPAVTCRDDDTLQVAMELMASHHVRRLAVRDQSGAVGGWVTLADLSRKLLVETESLQGVLQSVTQSEG